MGRLAAGMLIAAVVVGAWVAAFGLKPSAARPPAMLRLAHGGLGATGIACVAWALAHGSPDIATIVWEAAILAFLALALGLTLRLAGHTLGAARGMVLTLHALMGAAGAAILAGWAFG